MSSSQIKAAPSYDLTDSSNYNIELSLDSYMGWADNLLVDVNNNGKADLLTYGKPTGGTRGLYIIYDDLLEVTGKGNSLNLNDGQYTLFIKSDDGTNYGALGWYIAMADITGDGAEDIIISAWAADPNSRADAGSVFIIPNRIFSNVSGTGNDIDITDSNNWTYRIDGASAGVWLGEIFNVGDFNGDNNSDLVACAPRSSNNSRNRSGSCYLLDNSLISSATTGNVLDLASSDNYTARFDGATASSYGLSLPYLSDLDGDGRDELFIDHLYGTYPGRTNPGLVYMIMGSSYNFSGTGNNVDLATTSNYTARFIGDDNYYIGLPRISQLFDLDGDNSNDLFISSTNASKHFFFSNSFLSDYYSSSGTDIDLALDSNYVAVIENIQRLTALSNYTDDGYINPVVQDPSTDFSCTDCGSSYVIKGSLFNNISGTGNTIDALDESNYHLRIDGGNLYSGLNLHLSGDINGDGKNDFVVSAELRKWIIYNFPHTISIEQSDIPSGALDMDVTGNVEAPDSVSNISGVQWSLGNGPVNDTWNSCSADDGSFDSTSEEFTCDVRGLTGGNNTDVFVRAYDANTSYTAVGRYYSLNREGSGGNNDPDDPNVIQGWVKKILAGPNHHGTVEYIKDTAIDGVALLIPNEASNIDLHVDFEKIPVEKTIYIPDVSIPFPWSQGRNTVADVYNIDAQAAFNGNKVVETEGPFIITLNYDPEKLYGLNPNILKITRYNTETNKWTPITTPHVVNEEHSSISTTTTTFGYYTVSYSASVWR